MDRRGESKENFTWFFWPLLEVLLAVPQSMTAHTSPCCTYTQTTKFQGQAGKRGEERAIGSTLMKCLGRDNALAAALVKHIKR